jgi:plasmid stability protein
VRTTLTLDDDLAAALQKKADRTGRSFKEVVNEALRAGLEVGLVSPSPRRYRLRPAHLGGAPASADLDKALRMAGALEDEELIRKLELRK